MVKASTIMTSSVVTVTAETDIYEAIRTMVANDVTGLPVVADDGALVGIVTEKDVLSLLYNVEDHPGQVQDFMTSDVVAFDHETDVFDVAKQLGNRDFRRVPILDNGKLIGIVSRKDIIRYIKDSRRQASTSL